MAKKYTEIINKNTHQTFPKERQESILIKLRDAYETEIYKNELLAEFWQEIRKEKMVGDIKVGKDWEEQINTQIQAVAHDLENKRYILKMIETKIKALETAK